MGRTLSWIPVSLLGALVYGGYSLLLSLVDPALKKNKNAEFGYGILLGIINIPLNVIGFYIWNKKNKLGAANVLWKNINWKILLITVLVRFFIDPVHTWVINAGGAVAQQTMYSLAIIPVIIGGIIFFKQYLTIRQWIGLVLAGIGSFLMGVA